MTEGSRADAASVCVIGLGVAGLAVARRLKEAGVPFHAYDQADGVGGLWRYGSKSGNVYKSAHLISSKGATEFADFPMPEDYPHYPSHFQVCAYLEMFADRFGILDSCRFNKTVRTLVREEGFWRLTFEDGETARYVHVVIANGHHRAPVRPELPGEDRFAGEVIHASEYRDGAQLTGKHVVVVGAGNSGCDIAVDSVFYADSTQWSVRSGNHFVPKFVSGAPHDTAKNTLAGRILKWLPETVRSALKTRVIRLILGAPEQYGLPKPGHGFHERQPVVNSNVLYHVGHGDITVRRAIAMLDGDRVEFADGASARADLIILATGYRVSLPFLDDGNAHAGLASALRLNIFPMAPDGLLHAGLVELKGGAWRVRDLQARLIAAYLGAALDGPEAVEWFHAMPGEANPAASPDHTGQKTIFVDGPAYSRQVEALIQRFSRQS